MAETSRATVLKDRDGVGSARPVTPLEGFPKKLADRLNRKLPGADAHLRFAPHIPRVGDYHSPAPNARPAAVVALLYRKKGVWHVPLTLRPDDISQHAGQICFPGGRVEENETLEEAALRELREELGPISRVRVIGTLTPFYVFVSRHLVTPHVAITPVCPTFVPEPREVAELLEVPLFHLLDPHQVVTTRITVRDTSFETPGIRFGPHFIWGATCMMLSELVTVVRDVLSD